MKIEEKIDKLNSIGIALSAVHDLDDLLELIVLEARNLTGADAGSLYLRDGDELYFKVSQNATLEERFEAKESFFKPFTVPISRLNIAGYVTITSKPLNIEDAYKLGNDAEYGHSKEFDERFDYRTTSMLTVPMVDHKKQVIGVLQLINALDENGKAVPFTKEFESLVMSLASQAAVAINNAKFIEEIKELFKAVVQYSASAIDARSPHTAGHSERVSSLALELARAVNEEKQGKFADVTFSQADLEELLYAGWLHDIGKIGVKEIVLDKRNKLSDDNLASLVHKFHTLLFQKNIDLLKNKIELLMKEPPIKEFSEHEERFAEERERIKADAEFVKRVNAPKERMNDEDVDKLKSLNQKFLKDPITKKDIRLVSDSEFENLSVMRGSLNPSERKEAQSHVIKSIKIIEKIPFRGYMKNIPDIVSNHHEYLDGSGYPRGVKGEEISIQSRILCIVDIFDALAAKDRPYKPAMPIDRALGILRNDAKAGKLDSDLVELFIKRKVYSKLYS